MFIVIPMATIVESKLVPPALMSGKALPVKGISPTITAKFIKASITIQPISPNALRLPA
jgi:hypothetical protein